MNNDAKKELDFWMEFISKNEIKETTSEQITYYDFKRIFEFYFNNLSGELNQMISSLSFPTQASNIEIEINSTSYQKIIKLKYYINDNDYKIDSYVIDDLGIYYTGYFLRDEQVGEFYRKNNKFFEKIIPVYYLSYLFYRENSVFYKDFSECTFNTKLTFSNCHNVVFSIWREVNNRGYNYNKTIFDRRYLNHPEFNELYDEVLKRITIPISEIKDEFKYLIELAKIDNILIINDKKKCYNL